MRNVCSCYNRVHRCMVKKQWNIYIIQDDLINGLLSITNIHVPIKLRITQRQTSKKLYHDYCHGLEQGSKGFISCRILEIFSTKEK